MVVALLSGIPELPQTIIIGFQVLVENYPLVHPCSSLSIWPIFFGVLVGVTIVSFVLIKKYGNHVTHKCTLW